MATLTGNDGAILVNAVAVANVRSFSVEMTSDTIETTIMGTDVRSYVKGMSSFSGTCDIYFDPSECSGSDVTFNPTSGSSAVGAAPVAVKFYIDNAVSDDVGFTGSVIVTGYTINSSMDGMVEASLSFQGSGGTTFSTSGSL